MDTTTDAPYIVGKVRNQAVFTQSSLTLQTVSELFRTSRTSREQIAHEAVSESPATRSKSEEQS
jgi:hypothetical protein